MPIILQPRDGLSIKDARGFNVGGGDLARSLSWPLPSTTAGAARTAIGLHRGFPAGISEGASNPWPILKTEISVKGPLAAIREIQAGQAVGSWELLWPAPADAIPRMVQTNEGGSVETNRLRPSQPTESRGTVRSCFVESKEAQERYKLELLTKVYYAIVRQDFMRFTLLMEDLETTHKQFRQS